MKKQVFNPYLPIDEYVPDGEPHVFGDRLYVFGSHDMEGGDTYCMLDYVGYSAPVDDLSDWRYEGVLYTSSKDPHCTEMVEGYGPRKYLYAPDVVQGNDGRYYMYYCLSAAKGKGGFWGPISVAVCDTPVGEYEYLGDVQYPDGREMKRFIPFDPAVINDEGRIFLYYGWSYSKRMSSVPLEEMKGKIMESFNKSEEEYERDGVAIMGANCVELENDMLTVKSEPRRIIPCHRLAIGTEFEELAFFEASSIRKFNGKYYFIYSNQVNHQLVYAISDYPDRDFKPGGVIVSNGDVGYLGRKEEDRLANSGTNHGSIECVNGQYYIFYHRNTHLTSYSRQGVAEPITIESDGSIKQVCMTSCGLNNGPLQASGTYPAVICCNLTDGAMPHNANSAPGELKPYITHDDQDRFITNVGNGTLIGFKYFDFKGNTKLTVRMRSSMAQQSDKSTGILSIGVDERIADCFTDGTSNQLLQSLYLSQCEIQPSTNWKDYELTFEVTGCKPVYLVYIGDAPIDMLSISFNS